MTLPTVDDFEHPGRLEVVRESPIGPYTLHDGRRVDERAIHVQQNGGCPDDRGHLAEEYTDETPDDERGAGA
ncbi:hypothetical protein GCM10027415_10150 [Humibacter ginsengisoli]